MRFMKFDGGFVVKAEDGEEIVQALNGFCAEQAIRGASVQGIGAVREATIGFYDVGRKEYVKRDLKGAIEIVGLNGNVTMLEGRPFLHAHAVLAGRVEGAEDFVALGGHLFRGVVCPMSEIVVTVCGGAAITRLRAPGAALATMDLEGEYRAEITI